MATLSGAPINHFLPGEDMQKITTFLWFDHQAEEAANFYVSVFDDARIVKVSRYPEGLPAPAGSVMTVEFQLAGQTFVAMNAGPHFKFTEAISLLVECHSQEEVDRYWEQLSAGGAESQCGWLKDKYGLSWQITPRVLLEWNSDPDPHKASRVMQAMLKMKKIDIAALQRAYDQTSQ
jgi:predicted 3-demethylubiquinone-9 3-methyltransferase (glyoxalase superfamily)